MQQPGPRGWTPQQGSRPPNPQGGFHKFPQGPCNSSPRFPGYGFSQQGPRMDNRMPFNKDRPVIRPSQFSGPPCGPRPDRPPPNHLNPFGNGNPFQQQLRFGNGPQNYHHGMMRGPRPNTNFPSEPRFHQKPFHKNKPKQPPKPQQEKKEVKFFCDTCDRGYKDEDKYIEHVNGHEKCKYEGCTYIAAPKLVQLHINMQHRNGLAKKIWSMESPEDIKKWREERKKNFPTAENIAKKKADQASREERGEVIQEKYFGKMYGRGRGRGRGQGRGGRFDRRRNGDQNDDGATEPKRRKIENGDREEDKATSKNPNQGESKAEPAKQPDGDPLSFLLNSEGSENETANSSTTQKVSPKKPSAAGGLGSLMSSYEAGSSEEEEGEIVEKEDSSVGEENRLGSNGNEIGKQNSKDGNHNEKQGINRHGSGNQKDGNQRENGHHRQKRRGKKNQQKKKWEPSSGKFVSPPRIFDRSLLAKLLAKDIRRERNKILQCVHYIVKKDFFGIGKISKESGSSDLASKVAVSCEKST